MEMTRIYVTKDRKNIAVEITTSQAAEQKGKTAKIMRYLDRLEREKQEKLSKLKICPDCHLRCTPSGYCIRCGRDCIEDRGVKHITNRDAEFTPIRVKLGR